MGKLNSFGRAVYEGRIDGPDGVVVDIETGHEVLPILDRGFKKSELRHRVRSVSGQALGQVVDYQDTPEGVDYWLVTPEMVIERKPHPSEMPTQLTLNSLMYGGKNVH